MGSSGSRSFSPSPSTLDTYRDVWHYNLYATEPSREDEHAGDCIGLSSGAIIVKDEILRAMRDRFPYLVDPVIHEIPRESVETLLPLYGYNDPLRMLMYFKWFQRDDDGFGTMHILCRLFEELAALEITYSSTPSGQSVRAPEAKVYATIALSSHREDVKWLCEHELVPENLGLGVPVTAVDWGDSGMPLYLGNVFLAINHSALSNPHHFHPFRKKEDGKEEARLTRPPSGRDSERPVSYSVSDSQIIPSFAEVVRRRAEQRGGKQGRTEEPSRRKRAAERLRPRVAKVRHAEKKGRR